MKSLDLKTLNGILNVEIRTDGGIGIYCSTDDAHDTLMLNKDQLIELAGWIVTYLEEKK